MTVGLIYLIAWFTLVAAMIIRVGAAAVLTYQRNPPDRPITLSKSRSTMAAIAVEQRRHLYRARLLIVDPSLCVDRTHA